MSIQYNVSVHDLLELLTCSNPDDCKLVSECWNRTFEKFLRLHLTIVRISMPVACDLPFLSTYYVVLLTFVSWLIFNICLEGSDRCFRGNR